MLSLINRFLAKITVLPNGCWQWQGARVSLGYGWFCIKTKTHDYAHRVAYTLFKDSIPPKLDIHHVCKNKLCVNPEHLALVTPNQNSNLPRGNTGQFQRAKTHCPYRHPYTKENTMIRGNGGRVCRFCNQKRNFQGYRKRISKVRGRGE